MNTHPTRLSIHLVKWQPKAFAKVWISVCLCVCDKKSARVCWPQGPWLPSLKEHWGLSKGNKDKQEGGKEGIERRARVVPGVIKNLYRRHLKYCLFVCVCMYVCLCVRESPECGEVKGPGWHISTLNQTLRLTHVSLVKDSLAIWRQKFNKEVNRSRQITKDFHITLTIHISVMFSRSSAKEKC